MGVILGSQALFGAFNTRLTVVGAQRAGLDADMVVVGTLTLFVVAEWLFSAEALALLG